jgi:tetratricopeptide (TPR) repeat protein
MDPITRASKAFLKEAAASWKRGGHALFLEADATSRGDLIKTLRLAEWDPGCRRPLFLFEGIFAEAEGYFFALATAMTQDYEELRQGAAEEGVALPELSTFEDRPAPGAEETPAALLVASRAHAIARALDGKLEGIDIALVPREVRAPEAYVEATLALATRLAGSGARLLSLVPPGGPWPALRDAPKARFHVDPDELLESLKNLGHPASDGAKLRDLLLSAAQASREGDHDRAARLFELARARCRLQAALSTARGDAQAAATGQWLVEEAAVLMAAAGASLSAGRPGEAAGSYKEAFALATVKQAHTLAAQAALGEGAARLVERRYSEAAVAYSGAAGAAERAKNPILHVEALRMEGTATLAAGEKDGALRAWGKAIDVGSRMEPPARDRSSWEATVQALAALSPAKDRVAGTGEGAGS